RNRTFPGRGTEFLLHRRLQSGQPRRGNGARCSLHCLGQWTDFPHRVPGSLHVSEIPFQLGILSNQLLQARLLLRRRFTGQDFHSQNVKFWVHYTFAKSKNVFEKSFLVAQATRLYRPATRRTEWEQRFEPMGTAFSQGCSPQFRSAGRRPERASRPRYLFLNNVSYKVSYRLYRKNDSNSFTKAGT